MTRPMIRNSVSDRLSAGINVFFNLSVKDKNHLKEYIQAEIKVIRESHLKQMPPGFSFSRKLYRAFSIDPTKYRPSSEALWRRIKKKLEFPFVNPIVDLTNVLSLKYQVSYGLYDLDKIEGDIEITQGGEGESYQGIRKDIINLNGKILLKDGLGPFGNPSSDSLRTCTSDCTSNVLQVIFFHKDDPLKETILSETHIRYSDFFEISDSHSTIV
jgi:DNA/RNA-binding domain of Phe-tRNA-synthetase-like protein